MFRSYHLCSIVGDEYLRIPTVGQKPPQDLQELHCSEISGQFAVDSSCIETRENYPIVLFAVLFLTTFTFIGPK